MTDKNRFTLVILVALALGYGVSLKFDLTLTPPAAGLAKDGQVLLQADDDAPAEKRKSDGDRHLEGFAAPGSKE